MTPVSIPFANALAAGAGAAATDAAANLAARPFLDPLPVWNHWPWLILPLAVAVAVVYKSIKCRRMSQVPREAAVLTLWIVVGMAAAAGALAAIVRLVERMQT